MRRWPLAVGLSAAAHAGVGVALWAAVRVSSAVPPAEAPPPARAPSLLRVGSLLPRAGAGGVVALAGAPAPGGGRRDTEAPRAGRDARALAVGPAAGSAESAPGGAEIEAAAAVSGAEALAARAVERVAPLTGDGPEAYPHGRLPPGELQVALTQDMGGPALDGRDAQAGGAHEAGPAWGSSGGVDGVGEEPPGGLARSVEEDASARRDGMPGGVSRGAQGVGEGVRERSASGGVDGDGPGRRERRTGGGAVTEGAEVDLEALTRRVHARLSAVARDCYPAAARRFRQAGRVALAFCVDVRAEAERVEVSASGSDLLAEAARDCVVRRAAPFPSEAARRCFRVAVDFEP
ncbi:MAG: hypothetical protein INH41_06100 [Myxococcaceae bacterium]|nr:hypothetical protein [Myxococcaceae bacterium]MCA3011959.1 hypothetical protein [Myxococcaceae bacterium]